MLEKRNEVFKHESKSISFSVWCGYRVSFVGTIISPTDISPILWLDNYTKLCSIEADLSHLPSPVQNKSSVLFYRLDYELVLLFGLTEMKAQSGLHKDKVS